MSELEDIRLDYAIEPDELRYHADNSLEADGRVHVLPSLLNAIADKIARLTAELAELRERTRWIPVSERLPDNGQVVIAVRGQSVTTARYYYYVGVLSKHGWYEVDGMALGKAWATHWMPLPEPPEATDADN